MAQKKAGEVDAFLSRPDTSFPIVLLYGPDTGLVSERAARVAALSGVDASDPFASVVLAADELEKSIGRLFDEARTLSMFGGRRLIRIRGAGNGKALAEAVTELAADPPADAVIVIEAGDLRRTAPLRAAVERGRAAMALPCYPDEQRGLDRLIDEELAASGTSIDRAGRDALKARLGGDRLASRGEVRKLCLYAHGQAAITEADVLAVVGDVSSDTVEEAVDAALAGDARKLPRLFERLQAAGVSTYQIQGPLLRQFQQLLAMRQEMDVQGASAADIVARRRVHFNRAPALTRALQSWTSDRLAASLARIEADILRSRKEAALQQVITCRLLLELSVEAARARR